MASQISDGGATPHATNYSDLLDKVIAFAVGTGDWEIVSDQLGALGEIYLKGLDYSGDKNIYVGIKRYANVGTDVYGWMLQGYTGFTNTGFFGNPGAIPGQIPVLPLWNDTIPYWLMVNPRRILLVAKVAGVYMAMYLGLMLPYGSVGQWSYPLVVGGSNVAIDGSGTPPRYSDTSQYMCVPFIPETGSASLSPLVIRVPTGEWVRFFNGASAFTPPGGVSSVTTIWGVSPYCDNRINNGQATQGWKWIRPNLDGDYTLKPLRIMRGNTPDALGIFDGVKFIGGYGLSAEDTVTEGADEYIAFQDTFKTDLYRFFAIKDE